MIFALEFQLMSFEKDLISLWPCEAGIMVV